MPLITKVDGTPEVTPSIIKSTLSFISLGISSIVKAEGCHEKLTEVVINGTPDS